MVDVIFYEAFEEEQKELKKFLPRSVKANFTTKTIQESGDKFVEGRIICIRTQSLIPPSWKKKIEAVLSRSQGYDHLHRMFAPDFLSTKLGYLGPYCNRAVAEHAIMILFALAKKLKNQIDHFRTFERDGLTGIEFPGRKVLVVGVGEIGSDIVTLTKALGMDVKGVDIDPKRNDIEYVHLDSGLLWAEVIFCALPLSSDTNGLLDYSRLSQSRKRPYFINISRGEISPIQDLTRLLDEKKLRGVSLDVYQNEGMVASQLRSKSDPDESTRELIEFSRRDHVICTPHNAFNTEESVIRKAKATIESINHYLSNESFPYPVPIG